MTLFCVVFQKRPRLFSVGSYALGTMVRGHCSVDLVLACYDYPHEWLARLVQASPWPADVRLDDISPDRCGAYLIHKQVCGLK
jgi:hypothetical protein